MDTWTDSREHGPVVTVVTELTCLRGHRFSSPPSLCFFSLYPSVYLCLLTRQHMGIYLMWNTL